MSIEPEQHLNKQSTGNMLRSRREELHLSLEDVSQKIRIRLTFLKALEEGKIDQLPGIAYASGFLRSYTEFLGLDANDMLKHFRYEHQGTEYKQQLLFPAPVPRSGVPAAVIIFAGLLIIGGGYLGWYKMTDHRKAPVETIPSIMDNNGRDQVQEKISPQIASVMPAQKFPNTKPDQNVSMAIDKLESQIVQTQKVNNPAAKQAENVQNSQNHESNLAQNLTGDYLQDPQKSLPVQPVSGANSLNKTDPSLGKIKDNENKNNIAEKVSNDTLIKTLGASWLKIQDHQGHVLLQKTLQKGDHWVIPPDQENVVMTIGNAGVVIIENKGKQSKPLGGKGKVLRHFVITPELLEKIVTEPVNNDLDVSSVPSTNKKKVADENDQNMNDNKKTEALDN